jgi:hypothetical protein
MYCWDGTKDVYTARRTNNGTSDVVSGIYSWDAVNTEWVTHFIRQVKLFEQSPLEPEASAAFKTRS